MAKLGLTVTPKSIQSKLSSWEDYLDKEIIELKEAWEGGSNSKFQMVGDNWDKNILPSYRTSKDTTLSLHLFQVIAVADRVKPDSVISEPGKRLSPVDFIPSIDEQNKFREDLTFLVATSVIQHIDILTSEFAAIFPTHLEHDHSDLAGDKTEQVPLSCQLI